jgi:hypothetical protein
MQSAVAEPSNTSVENGWLDLPADPGYNGGLKGLSKGDRRALMRLKHARQVKHPESPLVIASTLSGSAAGSATLAHHV